MPEKPWGLSVKLFVRDRQGRLLLLKRSSRAKWFAGQWDLPGGKVDPGEALDVALHREATEETGGTCRAERFAGAAPYEMPHVRVILLFFEARWEGGEAAPRPGEHEEAAWVPEDEVLRLPLSDQLRPFVEGYLGPPRAEGRGAAR
jgi:8-oxo-dGTP diphosphatase